MIDYLKRAMEQEREEEEQETGKLDRLLRTPGAVRLSEIGEKIGEGERTFPEEHREEESLPLDRTVKKSLEPERTAEGMRSDGEAVEERRRQWEWGEETGLALQLRRTGLSTGFLREERRDGPALRKEEIREKTGWSVEDVDQAAERDSRRYDTPLPLY